MHCVFPAFVTARSQVMTKWGLIHFIPVRVAPISPKSMPSLHLSWITVTRCTLESASPPSHGSTWCKTRLLVS